MVALVVCLALGQGPVVELRDAEGRWTGSAVVVSSEAKTGTYLLTAAHCRAQNGFRVVICGREVCGRHWVRSQWDDLALLWVPASNTRQQAATLGDWTGGDVVNVSARFAVARGKTTWLLGSPRIEGVDAQPGRSGSGIFAGGRLVGITTGGSGSTWFVPGQRAAAFLERCRKLGYFKGG